MNKQEEQIKIQEYLMEFLKNKNYHIDSSFLGHVYSISENKKNKPIQEYLVKFFLEESISKISITKEFHEFIYFLKSKNNELIYPFLQNKIPVMDKYGNNEKEVLNFYQTLRHNRNDILKITGKMKIIENLLENNLVSKILDLLEKKEDKLILLKNVFKTKGFQTNIDKQKKIYAYCKEFKLLNGIENTFNLLNQNESKEKTIITEDKALYSTIVKIDINKVLVNNLDNTFTKENYKDIFNSLAEKIKKQKELEIQYYSFISKDIVEAVFIGYNPDIKLIDKAFEIVNEDINQNKITQKLMGYGTNTLKDEYFNDVLEKAKIKYFYNQLEPILTQNNNAENTSSSKVRNKI